MSSPTTTVGLDRVPGARRAPTSIHALAMAARERDRRLFFSTLLFAVAMLLLVPFAVLAAEQPLTVRLAEIEGRLTAFPRSTATELAQIAADDTPRDPALDRQIKTMYVLALVLSNRTTEALELAERMQASAGADAALRAGALLIRSDYEGWAGNSANSAPSTRRDSSSGSAGWILALCARFCASSKKCSPSSGAGSGAWCVLFQGISDNRRACATSAPSSRSRPRPSSGTWPTCT